jgi:hypothetical protein
MVKRISVLPIDLETALVTEAYATVLGEAAAVCLEENAHTSGVALAVDGMSKETFELNWATLRTAHRKTYADLQDATELGAYGVALLIVRQLTGKTVVERSVKGGGFDWWVGDPDPSGLPFQGKARLEVSGILKDRDGSLNPRMKQKRNQTDPSDSLGPAILAVVDFGQPRAQVENK